MKIKEITTRNADLVRKSVRDGYKVISIGFFPFNEHQSYLFTLRKIEE